MYAILIVEVVNGRSIFYTWLKIMYCISDIGITSRMLQAECFQLRICVFLMELFIYSSFKLNWKFILFCALLVIKIYMQLIKQSLKRFLFRKKSPERTFYRFFIYTHQQHIRPFRLCFAAKIISEGSLKHIQPTRVETETITTGSEKSIKANAASFPRCPSESKEKLDRSTEGRKESQL